MVMQAGNTPSPKARPSHLVNEEDGSSEGPSLRRMQTLNWDTALVLVFGSRPAGGAAGEFSDRDQ